MSLIETGALLCSPFPPVKTLFILHATLTVPPPSLSPSSHHVHLSPDRDRVQLYGVYVHVYVCVLLFLYYKMLGNRSAIRIAGW